MVDSSALLGALGSARLRYGVDSAASSGAGPGYFAAVGPFGT